MVIFLEITWQILINRWFGQSLGNLKTLKQPNLTWCHNTLINKGKMFENIRDDTVQMHLKWNVCYELYYFYIRIKLPWKKIYLPWKTFTSVQILFIKPKNTIGHVKKTSAKYMWIVPIQSKINLSLIKIILLSIGSEENFKVMPFEIKFNRLITLLRFIIIFIVLMVWNFYSKACETPITIIGSFAVSWIICSEDLLFEVDLDEHK